MEKNHTVLHGKKKKQDGSVYTILYMWTLLFLTTFLRYNLHT